MFVAIGILYALSIIIYLNARWITKKFPNPVCHAYGVNIFSAAPSQISRRDPSVPSSRTREDVLA